MRSGFEVAHGQTRDVGLNDATQVVDGALRGDAEDSRERVRRDENGLQHGFGKVSYNLNSPAATYTLILSYEGGFREGYYHGEGTATYCYSPSYASVFRNREYPTNYTGGWLWGDKSGHGTMTYRSGAKYEGGWKGNVESGWGIMIWSDGTSYEGGWKDGKGKDKRS